MSGRVGKTTLTRGEERWGKDRWEVPCRVSVGGIL